MISFRFKVGNAFLNYLHRPITIPKSQVSYKDIEAEQLHSDNVRVICPNGERMAGGIIYATAGYGPYYQIKIEGKENDPLTRLKIGEVLNVVIERIGSITEIRLNKSN